MIDGRELMGPVHVGRPKPVPGTDPESEVAAILHAVKAEGDQALVRFSREFDRVTMTAHALRVPEDTIRAARSLVRPELIDALEVMAERLRSTHERQSIEPWLDEREDEKIGELVRPLRRVGIYVPGGRATYPSSVLMAAIPAQTAGVEGICVATPPGARGTVPEVVLAACSVAGISEVYAVGGAQAIAALAYGTASVRPVEKIVGPGNLYVTLAKRLVKGWVGIDSEAGPTEIAIVADGAADPGVVAGDLIAQAEHGPLGSHLLITWSPELADAVMTELESAVLAHPRSEDVENALIEGGVCVLVRNVDQALETANAFAPEHLQLDFSGAWERLDDVHNAGAVFVGPYSPVPAGDYVGGTNHVLPSGGTARYASGLSVRDFQKTMYVMSLERPALERLANHIDVLAGAEGLAGHARAVWSRLEKGASG